MIDERLTGRMLFGAALLAIALRAAKAHYTGIVHDEAASWLNYGQTAADALTRYDVPNNHVLNSLLMSVATRAFGSYEHCIRVFPFAASALFTASVALLCSRVVHQPLLQLSVFCIVSLHYYLFDLSYLARGYSYALGASSAALSFGVVLVSRSPRPRDPTTALPLLVALNVIALASMPTSLVMLLAVNVGIYIWLWSALPRQRARVLVSALATALLTAGGTYFVYREVLEPMLTVASEGRIGHRTLSRHLRVLLVDRLYAEDGNPLLGTTARLAGLPLLAAAGLGLRAWWRVESPAPRHRAQAWLMGVLAGTFAAMLAYASLGRGLGHARNSVFLLPPLLLVLGIGLEAFARAPARAGPRGGRLAAVLVGLAVFGAWNLPSPRAVEMLQWERQSLSGPLLRHLHGRDPSRSWLVAVTEETRFLRLPLRYYQRFGYRARLARPGERPDIIVLPRNELGWEAFGTDVHFDAAPAPGDPEGGRGDRGLRLPSRRASPPSTRSAHGPAPHPAGPGAGARSGAGRPGS